MLSYNIHYGKGTHGCLNLKRIAKVILLTNPDIVALQEVDRRRFRTLWVDQVAKLEELTGFTTVFEPNISYSFGGEYGNVILTRFPVISHKNHLLPHFYGGQRGILEAELVVPQEYGHKDGFLLHFFVTHLEAGKRDSLERIASAHTIESIVQPILGTPMILAGDLNDSPNSHTMCIFRKIWGIAGDGKTLKTFPSISPGRQLDYVLFHPRDRWKVVEIQVIPEKIASDHRPILVVLKWTGGDMVKQREHNLKKK